MQFYRAMSENLMNEKYERQKNYFEGHFFLFSIITDCII